MTFTINKELSICHFQSCLAWIAVKLSLELFFLPSCLSIVPAVAWENLNLTKYLILKAECKLNIEHKCPKWQTNGLLKINFSSIMSPTNDEWFEYVNYKLSLNNCCLLNYSLAVGKIWMFIMQTKINWKILIWRFTITSLGLPAMSFNYYHWLTQWIKLLMSEWIVLNVKCHF